MGFLMRENVGVCTVVDFLVCFCFRRVPFLGSGMWSAKLVQNLGLDRGACALCVPNLNIPPGLQTKRRVMLHQAFWVGGD